MKKIFTLIALAMSSLTMMAEDYTCPLTVMGGPAGDVNVSVSKQDNGTYTMDLKNFSLMGLGVGNIHLADVNAKECGVVTALSTQQTIQITAGDDPSVNSWIGPGLGDVPINMKGEIYNGGFNAILSINMGGSLGVIGVSLGSKASELGQIPNSGFEDFHTAKYNTKTSDEPDAWHSFMSATGSMTESFLGNFTKGIIHTEKSNEVRNGSTGKQSVRVFSANAMGVSANGTITTGRLNAGSSKPEDKTNCSFLDLTNTDKDNNGDPFYTVLNGTPDAIAVWVKYHVGEGTSSANAHASISAVITDGTRYQDPEDKTYNNVVAKAQNSNITSNEEVWQKVVVPFDYDSYTSNNAEAKAILVTISTCAVPGGGSKSDTDPDAIWVDDLSLIYNAGVKSISVKGKDIALEANKEDYDVDGINEAIGAGDINVVSDGKGAYISKVLEENKNGGVTATITITSNDLKTSNVYTLNIKGATTGIDKVQNTTNAGVDAIYNVSGQKMQNMNRKGLYIVKKADGKTVKVLKK